MTDRQKQQWRQVLETLASMIDNLPDDAIEQHRERIEFDIDEGLYQQAKLHTPDGGEFVVGPAHVWGSGYPPNKQNVDIPIRRVPERLRDSGLGECSLTISNNAGIPLVSGPLKDDGNRQDGLGTICVAVLLDG